MSELPVRFKLNLSDIGSVLFKFNPASLYPSDSDKFAFKKLS